MENVILFDNEIREKLLPLTFTRPVGEIRVGILTIREKWERWLNAQQISFITQDYLAEKYPIKIAEDNYVVNGSALPSEPLCRLISQLEANEALLRGDELIAARLNKRQFQALINDEEIEELAGFDIEDTPFLKIDHLTDIFSINAAAIQEDFALLTAKRTSQTLSASNRVIGDPQQIFIEEGASVEGASLNVQQGPIYIGRDAEIMEGSLIRGPLALCEKAKLKMGSKVYGGTTIGPHSKIGGEVNNIVVLGYSSKSHEGFLGNSV
ncbi:MAG: putative sugar nucleotidyl transferase, partial [Bacteroidota bacterium]